MNHERPFPASDLSEARLRALRLLASDVDDTLSTDGRIPSEILAAFERLRRGGLLIWLVTGRCASWGQALSRYLPVDGVVAENGGVICRGELLTPLADLSLIGGERSRLKEAYEAIRRQVPRVRQTDDNLGRLTDWAIDRAGLSDDEVSRVADLAAGQGLKMIASSIHLHLYAGEHTKATAVGRVCDELGLRDRQEVLTLGDSTNDEPLFDPAQFLLSAGVANVERFLPRLTHKPLFILPLSHSAGALWLLNRILVCR